MQTLVYPDVSGRNATYEGLVLGMAPLFYAPMQETNGTVAEDLGSGGNDGTYTNGPTLGEAGPIARVLGGSRAVGFDGTNEVALPNGSIAPTTAFTVCGWVNLDNTRGTLLSTTRTTFGSGLWIGWEAFNSNAYIFMDGINNNTFASGSPPRGVWTHIAATWQSGATARWYENGALKNQSGILSGSITNNGIPAIGFVSNAGYAAQGSIAHVAYWPTQLTPAQIESLYLCGLNGQ